MSGIMTAIWKRTWRERVREIELQRREWKEMEGGAEGGRKGDNQWMKMV